MEQATKFANERSLNSEERAAKAQILEHIKNNDHNAYEAVMRAQRDGRAS
jgi:hypothetical protein